MVTRTVIVPCAVDRLDRVLEDVEQRLLDLAAIDLDANRRRVEIPPPRDAGGVRPRREQPHDAARGSRPDRTAAAPAAAGGTRRRTAA